MNPIVIPDFIVYSVIMILVVTVVTAVVAGLLYTGVVLIRLVVRMLDIYKAVGSYALAHRRGFRLVGDRWEWRGKGQEEYGRPKVRGVDPEPLDDAYGDVELPSIERTQAIIKAGGYRNYLEFMQDVFSRGTYSVRYAVVIDGVNRLARTKQDVDDSDWDDYQRELYFILTGRLLKKEQAGE